MRLGHVNVCPKGTPKDPFIEKKSGWQALNTTLILMQSCVLSNINEVYMLRNLSILYGKGAFQHIICKVSVYYTRLLLGPSRTIMVHEMNGLNNHPLVRKRYDSFYTH